MILKFFGVFTPRFCLILPYSKASGNFPWRLEWHPKSSPWPVKHGQIWLPATSPTSSLSYFLLSYQNTQASLLFPEYGFCHRASRLPGTLQMPCILIPFVSLTWRSSLLKCLLLLVKQHLSSFSIPFLYFLFPPSTWYYISIYLYIYFCLIEGNHHESSSPCAPLHYQCLGHHWTHNRDSQSLLNDWMNITIILIKKIYWVISS